MNIGPRLKLDLRMHLALTGGATKSVFPLVERWLAADSDRQKALQWIADKERMRKYRSVVDFLLCETVHYYQAPCQRYYAGKGPKLRDHVGKAEINRLQTIMLRMIAAAYLAFSEKRRDSWEACREIALAA